ncbi:MAG: tyrosine-type recombinase/integrase [Anaerolineales bacterium]|nr:tyrosine-type recombinase/integrase [Anaerolineales bacterium]
MPDHEQKTSNQHMTREKIDGLETWVTAFLRDCKTRGLSAFTVEFYRAQLQIFAVYCKGEDVTAVLDLTPDMLRGFLLMLETKGHNAGGRHAAYRAVRVFLRWYEVETEPEAWVNPVRKVKPPKVTHELIKGVPAEDIKAMLETCGDNFTGVRDRALLLCLLDTGARAREFLSLNLDDVDFVSGAVDIRKGKGNKSRTVFIGKKSRKALRAYIRLRTDKEPCLWVTFNGGGRLAVNSLRQVLVRHAELAGMPVASAHKFRRSFALALLRAKVDIFSIQKLMGHAGLDVLRLYLAQNTDDVREAHERGSPVDGLL